MPANANSNLGQVNNAPMATSQPATQNMAPDPLAAFKDLQMPDPVSWWPLAWGWWVLIAVLVGIIAFAIYRLVVNHKHKRAQKEALQQIKALSNETPTYELNRLLKQAMLSYYPREIIAGLTGASWYEFLIQQLKENRQAEFSKLNAFCLNLYQANTKMTTEEQDLVIRYIKLVLPVRHTNKQKAEVKHV